MVKEKIKNQKTVKIDELEASLIKKNEELEKRNIQLQIELDASKIVHESLREGQNFLQEVLLSEGETLVLVIDENNLINFVWGSKRLEKKYGIVFQSFMGQSFKDFFCKYIIGEYPEQFSEDFNKFKPLREKLEAIMPSGAFWWDITFSPIMDNNNETWTIVITVRDITQLKEIEDKFTTIADFTVDWEYWYQPEKGFVYVSPSCQKISGYSPDDFYLDSKMMEKIIISADLKIWLEHPEGKSLPIEFRIISKNGEIKWIEHACQKVIIKGKDMGVRGSQRDITDRKLLEQKLKKNEEKQKTFMEEAPDAFIIYDKNLNLTEFNSAALSLFPKGTKKEVILGKNILEIAPNVKETGRYDKYREVLKTGKSLFFKDIVPHPKFGDIHLNVRVFKVGDGLGFIARNITEDKLMEQKLLENKEKYQILFESSPIGIGISELDGKVLSVNRRMEEITGYTMEEFKSISLSSTYLDPNDQINLIQKLTSNDYVRDYEVKLKKKDGTVYVASLNISMIKIGGKRTIITNCIDITEKKLIEAKLLEVENYKTLTSLFDGISDSIAILDPKTYNIIYSNESFSNKFNHKALEIVGEKCYKIIHKEQVPCCNLGIICAFDHALKSGLPFSTEHVHYNSDNTKIYGEISTIPLKNGIGEIIYLVLMMKDKNKQKEYEEKLQTNQVKTTTFS